MFSSEISALPAASRFSAGFGHGALAKYLGWDDGVRTKDTDMTHTTANGLLYGVFRANRFAPDRQNIEARATLLFPGQGCVPWLKTGGEMCDFCQLPAGARFAVLGAGHEDHFEAWHVSAEDYREMVDTSFAEIDGVDSVAVFNGGSFLTDLEIPAETRAHLYRAFAQHPTSRHLMVESRPQFVTAKMLDEARAIIGTKSLMIGIGLESVNHHVRNKLLRKFIGWTDFERALRTMRESGCKSLVYVFLGAPSLTEREAYDDALRSIRTLNDMGVDEIALSCAFVPPGGKLAAWYETGTFRPPWLWTVARLIQDARANGWPLSVGGFDDFPPPLAISQNCGSCDEGVLASIQRHRETGAFALDVSCDCHAKWSELMSGHGSV